MFTSIMNSVINEVTRHGGSAELVRPVVLSGSRAAARKRIRAARPPRAVGGPPAKPLRRHHRVLANTFKIAAGYY
jgi:hypothetical protein